MILHVGGRIIPYYLLIYKFILRGGVAFVFLESNIQVISVFCIFY